MESSEIEIQLAELFDPQPLSYDSVGDSNTRGHISVFCSPLNLLHENKIEDISTECFRKISVDDFKKICPEYHLSHDNYIILKVVYIEITEYGRELNKDPADIETINYSMYHTNTKTINGEIIHMIDAKSPYLLDCEGYNRFTYDHINLYYEGICRVCNEKKIGYISSGD